MLGEVVFVFVFVLAAAAAAGLGKVPREFAY